MARTLGGVALPDGTGQYGSIEWTDRYDWSPVAQAQARTLSGALVVFEAALTAGRPITLEARDGVCWLHDDTLAALLALAAVVDASYTLTWAAESYRVAFDHGRGQAIQAAPIWPHHALHTGRIQLITV